MRACALSVPSSGHTRCVFRHVCQSFRVCVCVFVTRESRASKGKDDSPAPPPASALLVLPPLPTFPPLLSPLPEHSGMLLITRRSLSFSQRSRQKAPVPKPVSVFLSFFSTHPLTRAHIDIHRLTHNTHAETHTSSLCLHSGQSK